MKNNYIQDERILSERRKIQSRGYAWITIILLISVVVQQFILNAPFAQYAVELFLLFGCGLYNIISNYQKGIDIWNPKGEGKKQILFNTILTGIASVLLFAFLSGNFQKTNLLLYFVAFIVFFFITRLIMIAITNKKLEAIDKEIDNDDFIE